VECLGCEAHCKPFLCTPRLESPMTEERKCAILLAATLLCVRTLIERDRHKPSTAKEICVDEAIEDAAYMIRATTVATCYKF
jgi:hypothetical protein